MANQRQLDTCVKKLWKHSPSKAVRFRELLMEADELAFRAAMLRMKAWDIYRDYYPPKRKAPSNEDLI